MSRFIPIIAEFKPSKLIPGQVGVFAVQDIKKDSVIFKKEIYDEDVLFCTWEEFAELDEVMKDKIMDFGLGNKEGALIPEDFNRLSLPWYMNHSCDYNMGFNARNDFVAAKDISKGEEICYDYGLGEGNPNFKMKCLCGSHNCRGIITGNDWMNPDYREKNINYMLGEFR